MVNSSQHDRAAGFVRLPGTQFHLPSMNRIHSAERWGRGLCDMAMDIETCPWTCFCPCVTFGGNVAARDQGPTTSCRQVGCIRVAFLVIGLSCFCSVQWRKRLRKEVAMPGGECGDHCLHF